MNAQSKMTVDESAIIAELWTTLVIIWLQLQRQRQQEQMLEKEKAENEVTILKLKEKIASCKVCRDGILRWTIPDFQKSPPIDRIQSDDFFSVEGHKMSAKILVNGGGKLSVSLTVSEWAHGGLQPFPYRRIRFQIRSPKDDNHYEKIMKVGCAAEDGVTLSPQNATVGFSDFVEMSELHSKCLFEGGKLFIMIELVKDM